MDRRTLLTSTGALSPSDRSSDIFLKNAFVLSANGLPRRIPISIVGMPFIAAKQPAFERNTMLRPGRYTESSGDLPLGILMPVMLQWLS